MVAAFTDNIDLNLYKNHQLKIVLFSGLHKMYSLDGDWVFTDGTKPPFSSIDWGKSNS